MFEVTTPNPVYCGVTDGVAFANGKAIVSDAQKAEELKANYGYTITAISPEAPAEPKAKRTPAK